MNDVGLLRYLLSDTEQDSGGRHFCPVVGCSNLVSVNGSKCSVHVV